MGLVIRTQLRSDPRIVHALDEMMWRDPHWTVKNEHLWALSVWGYARFVSNEGWAGFNARWAWSTEQIELYKQSPQYHQLVSACNSLRLLFEQQNPGYSLRYTTQPRDRDSQIRHFRNNPYTDQMGQSVLRQLEDAIQDYPDQPSEDDLDRFWRFLCSVRFDIGGHRTLTNATPGLSPHGRLTAIDFVVVHGGATVAAAVTAAINTTWRGPGQWATKLRGSIILLNAQHGRPVFEGPLQNPDEPWHFRYRSPAET